jgi:hypothetical protein
MIRDKYSFLQNFRKLVFFIKNRTGSINSMLIILILTYYIIVKIKFYI